MSTKFRIVLLAFCIAFPGAGFSAGSASDLLKEAQYAESTSRDLEAASRLYGDFLKQPGTDRRQQAEAYLHLGLCQSKMGKRADAKAAWKKIIQDYSDQTDSYSEALNQLQQLQIAERAELSASSPTIRVVKIYENPPPRWMVEFPRGMFLRSIDGKGELVDTAGGAGIGFVHFPQPNLGVGMEIGGLGASGPPSARRNIAAFTVLARAEKPLINGLTFYAKGGPGIYLFSFKNNLKNESKVNIGALLETGLVIGMPRGFAFNFGYLVHAFGQSTPSQDFVNTIPPADITLAEPVTQNRGLRFLGGPAYFLAVPLVSR